VILSQLLYFVYWYLCQFTNFRIVVNMLSSAYQGDFKEQLLAIY